MQGQSNAPNIKQALGLVNACQGVD